MPAPKELSAAGKMLSQAEDMYDNKDYDKAKPLFLKSLELLGYVRRTCTGILWLWRASRPCRKDPDLLRAAAVGEDARDGAQTRKVKAWSLVYLGKLADIAGNGDEARKSFEDALDVKGISNKAREEAEKGLKQISKP